MLYYLQQLRELQQNTKLRENLTELNIRKLAAISVSMMITTTVYANESNYQHKTRIIHSDQNKRRATAFQRQLAYQLHCKFEHCFQLVRHGLPVGLIFTT